MGGIVPQSLVASLDDVIGLQRAVETGTFGGDGTRVLAAIFPRVITIELSTALHKRASAKLQIFDAVRTARPTHHVTVLDDQVIAVPPTVKSAVDRYGQELAAQHEAKAKAGQRPPLIYRALDRIRSSLPRTVAGMSNPE
jgi:hypothetical protein